MKPLRALLLVCLALLAGCGFQLRGHPPLPFASAFVDAPRGSRLAAPLKQALTTQGKVLRERAKDAELHIILSEEGLGKEILALSGGGKVREYRLSYRVTLSAQKPDGGSALLPVRLLATRDFSYSDTDVLAKEGEETQLRLDMEREVLQQVLRRLAFAQP